MFDRKKTGAIIIGFSIALFVAIIFESLAFQQVNVLVHTGCNLPEGICPANNPLPYESFVPLTINTLLLFFGLYLLFAGDEKPIRAKPAPSGLGTEEKRVYKMVSDNGAMLQSEIIEKTGISKVKMTRILDKLEAKQVIERQRRGMTNLVKIKTD